MSRCHFEVLRPRWCCCSPLVQRHFPSHSSGFWGETLRRFSSAESNWEREVVAAATHACLCYSVTPDNLSSWTHPTESRRSRTPEGCSWRMTSWNLPDKSCWGTAGYVGRTRHLRKTFRRRYCGSWMDVAGGCYLNYYYSVAEQYFSSKLLLLTTD